jgi:hypothetical protein
MLGATLCGAGYLQGSFACSACAANFFLQDDGSCASCPVLTSAWDRYQSLLYILIALFAMVAFVWAGLWVLVHVRGGTLAGGAVRMLHLGVWGLMAAQVVANAASVTSSTLPPLITSLYRAIVVLQLQNVLLPPSCTGDYPFFITVLLMSAALFAWALAVAAYYARPFLQFDTTVDVASDSCCRLRPRKQVVKQFSAAVNLVGRCALVVALVLYSNVAGAAVDLLACRSVSMAAKSAAALDGGPSMTTVIRGASVSVAVLSSNPFFACWAGSHRAAGMLAGVVLALYVMLMPLVTLMWLWRDPYLRSQHRNVSAEITSDSHACEKHLSHVTCVSYHSPTPVMPPAGYKLVPHASRISDLDLSVLHLGADMPTCGTVDISHNPLQNVSPVSPAPTLSGQNKGAISPPPDMLLDPFLGDYESRCWYTKHVDLALLLLLSLLRVLLPRPTTLEGIVSKSTVSCACILSVCAHVLLVKPFLADQAWKGWVRAMLLLVSAGCVGINGAVAASDLKLGGVSLAVSISIGSYGLLVACALTFVVLIVGFAVTIYKGA